MANRTFNIKVTMNERWVDDFCSVLEWMESCGVMGHSSLVGFYADGDGDFRPTFEIDTEYNEKPGRWNEDIFSKPEVVFDAG